MPERAALPRPSMTREPRMTEIRIADEHERHAALDVTRSFIVQAPAGSGKTALLVERYLRLLKTVQKPEEIVAITFTKKAAAEMRRRVIEQISPELAPRLRIQTIDALCASLTAQMPVLSKFGAQPQVVEDASALYAEAAARTLAEITPAVASMLAHLDNDVARATGMLAEILGRRDQWLPKTGEAPTRAELEATLAAETEAPHRPRQGALPAGLARARRGGAHAEGRLAQAPQARARGAAGDPGPARSARGAAAAAAREIHRQAVGRAARDPRAPQARGGAAAHRSSASAARWTSPRSRTARCARSARPTSPPTCCFPWTCACTTCWWTSSRTPPTRSGSSSSASPPAGRRTTGAPCSS